ncbi:heat shock protein Hsp90 [Chloropicon primus]|nr:heat shock protein Hsp90 [Chloropicon primus]
MGIVLVVALAYTPGCWAQAEHAAAAASTTTTTTTTAAAASETFTFQAEVSRLLDIIINSLYSNKDIFLRELISNASDALDKIRLLSLTDPDALRTGKELEVRISVDKEKGVLVIRDTGVGMTKEELVRNLGTIAKSGTSAFIDQVTKGAVGGDGDEAEDGDASGMNLIGQFGVGFYSAFLAADKVQVVSKGNGDDGQHVWESAADGNFAVYEDPLAEERPLGRGTQLNLFIKEEAKEYLDQNVLADLVKQYSQFINYPIFLLEEEKRDIEVEATEEDEIVDDDEDDNDDDNDDDEEEEEEEDEEEGPKMVTKTITEEVWRRKNDAKAIWLRNPSEVEDEEYSAFFKTIAKGQFHTADPEPFAKSHFKAEGDVEFRSILYIPKDKPRELQQQERGQAQGMGTRSRIKLFVRRVFISDSFSDLIPSYLNFVIGVVDSDTLPLNVNRESLQHHASLKTIKKKLIRKTLDMLKKMADKEKADKDENEEEPDTMYTEFWKTYGPYLKMGVIEDQPNRIRLSKLIRFKSSHSEFNNEEDDAFTDFASYISRMPENQKKMYYLIGGSVEEVKSSPFAEKLKKRGYEVIYFTEPLDEYLMQYLVEFNDYKFQNAAKEDLSLDDTDDDKKKQKQVRQHFRPFTKWWKELLSSSRPDIDSVKVSNRLVDSPCVVVSSKYGYTANMEKIVKAQAMADKNAAKMYLGKKVLEINPWHPSIKKLKALYEDDAEAQEVKEAATLMYETSLLESGFEPQDPRMYAKAVYNVLNDKLGVDKDAPIVDDFVYEEEKKEEEEEEAAEEETVDFDFADKEEL